PEEKDATQSVAVQLSQVPCHQARDLVRIERSGELGQLWIRPFGERPLAGGLIDEPLVHEPGNRPPLDTRVVKAKPGVAHLREIEQRVLEAAKSAAPRDRPLEQITSLRI